MNSYIWVIVEKFGGVLLKVLGMMLLARVLTPTDFGLFGMVFVLSAFGMVLIDSGLGGALIKKRDVKNVDYSTVFTFNLIVSIALCCCFYFSSGLIADFYNEEKLKEVIPLLSIVLIIRALTLIPVTKMTKSLQFKIQTQMALISYILALSIGYYMARQNYGVLALVYISLFDALFYCVLMYVFSRYKPSFSFDITSFKELYPFGIKLSAASLIRTFYENSLNIVVGKVFGPQLLGFYYQASKINDIFLSTTTSVINKAAFPILVDFSDTPKLMKSKMKILLTNVCWLTFLICILLSLNAENIILIMFGEQWLDSAWMLAIISLAGFGMIVEATTRCFLKSHGLADVILKLEFKKRAIGVFVILMSSFFSLQWMLLAYVFTTLISSLLNMMEVSKATKYKFLMQVRDIMKPLLSCFFIYITMFFLKGFFITEPVLLAFVTFFIPCSIYLLLAFFFGVLSEVKIKRFIK
ncbi:MULTISPECIES: lipopolysaccharide biosynthesis protein [unclassified Pseudoalteromonas]|uniref:lipopolysaccharide biosynthesis protein n=1 Tax=unclassified Pseudoalteromonas TaxID=194690 RepID=UPI001F2CB3C2|nr:MULTISPECIES: lipopolysaccharide biosynthesis protein [unclassified Pseudoalteromonas]MCF2825870.1 lipopolysaccharide biosynthesis protein [Pseudoalteromonas sp. OF5H-5]MCF2834386.1 lipopolysaccharide biosynthesis protein [Pseudoalteromonas sp. DL2-H6]MCF2927260.1 lipopolysaccharide biosynthesis protein [Pseudoalteromonas sp. DL2-H1]